MDRVCDEQLVCLSTDSSADILENGSSIGRNARVTCYLKLCPVEQDWVPTVKRWQRSRGRATRRGGGRWSGLGIHEFQEYGGLGLEKIGLESEPLGRATKAVLAVLGAGSDLNSSLGRKRPVTKQPHIQIEAIEPRSYTGLKSRIQTQWGRTDQQVLSKRRPRHRLENIST